jgi:hypothetical protein
VSEHTTIGGQRVYGDSADPDGPWTVTALRCRCCRYVWAIVKPFSIADAPEREPCPQCSTTGAEEVSGG